ncbi:MAG TPA: phosphopantetheine-binding protein [Gemmatimonadales bacterium]|nr:phosphopantetheine-binding protein [Gemmatimonadales bacterium]
MTQQEIENAVLRILGTIAPEADLTRLRPDVPFRDQLDIDSIDLLNFFIAVDKELHVAIPETDYAMVATLKGCVQYLASALAVRA